MQKNTVTRFTNTQHIFIYNKITAFVDNRTNPYCDVTINHATLY